MSKKPTIEVTKNAFKIMLPNINAKYENNIELIQNKTEKSNHFNTLLNDDEEKTLEYVKEHNFVTKNQVSKLLKVSDSTSTRILQKLVKKNFLKQKGAGRNTRYTIINE